MPMVEHMLVPRVLEVGEGLVEQLPGLGETPQLDPALGRQGGGVSSSKTLRTLDDGSEFGPNPH